MIKALKSLVNKIKSIVVWIFVKLFILLRLFTWLFLKIILLIIEVFTYIYSNIKYGLNNLLDYIYPFD